MNYLAFSSGNVCCFMALNVLRLMNKMLARQKANTFRIVLDDEGKKKQKKDGKGGKN